MKLEINQRIAQIKNNKIPEGYKSTAAGILPIDWGCVKLSELSSPITQTAGTEKYETLSISAGIGFVNQAKKFGKELSGKQYEKYTVLHKGDFSYNKGNSKKYPQGCMYRLTDRECAAVPNVFESFRIESECPEYYDQLFISGFLNHQLFRLINHGVRDDGLLNLTHKDFYSCFLPVPPISEQKHIAKTLFAQDKIIECYEKKIEQLKQMKKYYLQNMFPKHGETVPKIRFKGFTDPWEQRKLGECFVFMQNNTLSRAELQSERGAAINIHYGDVLIKYGEYLDIALESMSYTPNQSIVDKLKGSLLADGDIIMADTAEDETVGKCSEIAGLQGKAALSGLHTIPLRPKEKYESGFLGYYMNSGAYHNQLLPLMQGIKVTSISKSDVKGTEISYPQEKSEQASIGRFFIQLDNLITLHQRKCEKEKKKKKALQQLLLTGIVRVKL